ncbi:MAG: TadE/TadG family type IV pilus assembly protein [Pseudomonadota bacterium]
MGAHRTILTGALIAAACARCLCGTAAGPRRRSAAGSQGRSAAGPQGRSAAGGPGRFAGDRRGGATVEFVVVAVPLFLLLFTMIEAGLIMASSIMVERGLQVAVRDIRVGSAATATHAEFKTRVCEAAFLIGNCEKSLMIEMVPFADVASYADRPAVACVDRANNIVDPTAYGAGGGGDIIFVRACLLVDPLFPGAALASDIAYDDSGATAIAAQGAFMREPD